MKKNVAIVTAIGIVAAVALAFIVAPRLSNEALAVAVGAVCGISASIPATFGLFIAAASRPRLQDDLGQIVLPTMTTDAYRPQPKLLANTCEHGVPIATGYYCGSCAGGRREPRMLNA